jgi:hypothetical protein
MVVSNEAHSSKDFRTLIIQADRLERERAELLALREKVSDAERATLSLASSFLQEGTSNRACWRQLICRPSETRRSSVAGSTLETR